MTYVLEKYSFTDGKYKFLNTFSAIRFYCYKDAEQYCRSILFESYDFNKRHDPLGDYYPDFQFVVYKGEDGKDYFEDNSSNAQDRFRGYYMEEE